MNLIELNSQVLAEKLQALTADALPKWGKMNSTQMLQHLIDIFRVSREDIKVEFANKVEDLPKLHYILSKPVPLPKEFPAPDNIENLINKNKIESVDLELLKAKLIEELSLFEQYFKAQDQPEFTTVNAVFGPLNYNQWQYFHQKHISHHFAQFNLWEY